MSGGVYLRLRRVIIEYGPEGPELLIPDDAPEVGFGGQECRGRPAQHHRPVLPPRHSPGPEPHPGVGAFHDIRRSFGGRPAPIHELLHRHLAAGDQLHRRQQELPVLSQVLAQGTTVFPVGNLIDWGYGGSPFGSTRWASS